MQRADLIDRIWERDATVWTGADEAKWLGWLDEPSRMRERVPELLAFADEVADGGFDAIVLLGMGGSSLAPEVLRRTFRSEAFLGALRQARRELRRDHRSRLRARADRCRAWVSPRVLG